MLARAGVQLTLSRQYAVARRRNAQLEAQWIGLRTHPVEQHELLDHVVQELRTPLAGSLMAAELLLAKSRSKVPHETQESLQFIPSGYSPGFLDSLRINILPQLSASHCMSSAAPLVAAS